METDRSLIRALALVGCLTLAGAPATAPAAATSVSQDDHGWKVVAKIEKIVSIADLESSRSREKTARALANLGEPAVPPLFATFRDRSWPTWPELGEGAIPFDARHRDVVLRSLGLLRDPHTLDFLARFVDAGSGDRVAAIMLLAEIGHAKDLELTARIASVADENGELDPTAAGWFGNATRMILARDPKGYDRLRKTWPSLNDTLRKPAIEAVGANGQPEGLELAIRFLGSPNSLDAEVLRQIQVLAGRMLVLPHDLSVEKVREYLWDKDAALRSRAALCVGMLADTDAVERMIELLDDGDKGVRQNAYRGIKQITGLTFPSSSQRWQIWHREELTWQEQVLPAVIDWIRSDDPTQVSSAVQALSRHPLSARSAVEELAELLRSEDPTLRRLACAGMEQIGSSAAIPALLARLDDEDQAVADAAAQAMRTLTGKNLNPDIDAWCAAFPELRSHR